MASILITTILIISICTFTLLIQRTVIHFKHPGAKNLFYILVCYFIWAFCALLILQNHDLNQLIFLSRFKFLGINFFGPLWALIILRVFYSDKVKVTPLLTTIFVAPSIVMLILMWLPATADYFIYNFSNVIVYGVHSVKYYDGPLFKFHIFYTYSFIYAALLALVVPFFIKKNHFNKKQATTILLSMIVSVAADSFALFYNQDLRWLQLTPATLLPAALGLSFALFRYQFLDLYLLSRNVSFENTKNPIFVFDQNNKIKNYNSHAPKMTPKKFNMGDELHDVFNFLPDENLNTLEKSEPLTIKINNPHTQAKHYYRVEYDLVKRRDGTIQGKIITFIDISNEKKLTNELEEYIALKNKLLSIISHDVLGNINSLNSLSTQLFDKVDELDRERIKKTLGVMSYSSLVSKDFLFNLLHWIKGQDKKLELYKENFYAQELIERCIKEVAPIGHSREVTISNKTEENFKLKADQNILALITRNLLSNAIKHGARNSEVEIKAEQKDGHALFSISNKGDRLTNSFLNSLFEKEKNKKNHLNADSIGMGLNLCIDFVEAHNGKIWANPNEEGGCVFSFSIPLEALQR